MCMLYIKDPKLEYMQDPTVIVFCRPNKKNLLTQVPSLYVWIRQHGLVGGNIALSFSLDFFYLFSSYLLVVANIGLRFSLDLHFVFFLVSSYLLVVAYIGLRFLLDL